MKTIRNVLTGSAVLSLTLAILAITGCETRERVVVHDRPPPAEVRVVAPPPPVVQERVIVRP